MEPLEPPVVLKLICWRVLYVVDMIVVCGHGKEKNRCRCHVTVKKVLLREVVFIKLEVKKATRVDLTMQ